MSQVDNRRIAKNAIALYFRTFITMLIGLYTSRVILQALGVVDFGIYNVVGGFVSMFSLISVSLTSSIGRYITFELGKGDEDKLRRVFSTSIFVVLGLSLLVFIATETFGLWYFYNKMVIPPDRMDAAFWVFQISVFTFILSLINMPYASSIIAHERMDIYAYLSIFDATCKLLICYLVMHSPIDRLIFYSLLFCAVGVIDQCIYVLFCKRNFEESHFKFVFDKTLFKGMFGFAGWNFIGSSAAVLRNQGANLLLNAFGGPVVNAANGIANTITGIVSGFVSNFTQAFNPQITKQYAAGEYESLMKLLIYGSKYSYYLLFLLSLPVMLNAHFILKIWLGVVPDYTVDFCRWIFIFLLAESVSRPIITAKNATGEIRNYQIVVGGILLLMLPISYICLRLGASVISVVIANAGTAILAVFARMYMLRGDFPCWSSRVFINKVLLNVLLVSIVSAVLPTILYLNLQEGWIRLLSTSTLAVICSIGSILYVGCTKSERGLILSKCKEGIKTLRQKISNK